MGAVSYSVILSEFLVALVVFGLVHFMTLEMFGLVHLVTFDVFSLILLMAR